MAETTTFETATPTQKIYKETAILGGSFLGGPLAAAYLIAENFKAFHQPDKAKKTWIYAILFTILLFASIVFIPDDIAFPTRIIPIAYTVTAYYLVKHFQQQSINAHGEAGGLFFNGWRVVAVGLIGLIITIIPVLGYALVTESTATNAFSEKTYGVTKNTIDYDKNTMTETDADRLADALIKTAFFDDEVTKYVYVKKVNNSFELSISTLDGMATDIEVARAFTNLKTELQSYFPSNNIVLVLVGENLDQVKKRIE